MVVRLEAASSVIGKDDARERLARIGEKIDVGIGYPSAHEGLKERHAVEKLDRVGRIHSTPGKPEVVDGLIEVNRSGSRDCKEIAPARVGTVVERGGYVSSMTSGIRGGRTCESDRAGDRLRARTARRSKVCDSVERQRRRHCKRK